MIERDSVHVLLVIAFLSSFTAMASAATSDICSSGSKTTTCTVTQTYDVTGQNISGTGDLVVDQSGKLETSSGPQTSANLDFDNITVRGDLTGNFNITSEEMRLADTATVSADGKGFGSRSGPGSGNNGDGFDDNQDTGAGYGGRGGRTDENFAEGDVYGSVRNPTQLGSGGGAFGSRGGGKILINVSGKLSSQTVISANAEDSGNGAGGTININASILDGNLSVSASGGEGSFDEGGGAGGRIAVRYDSNQTDRIDFDVSPGDAGFDGNPGQQGTVFVRQIDGEKVVVKGTPDLSSSEIDSEELVIASDSDDVRMSDSNISSTDLSVKSRVIAELDGSRTNFTRVSLDDSSDLNLRRVSSDVSNLSVASSSTLRMTDAQSDLESVETGIDSSIIYSGEPTEPDRILVGNSSSISIQDSLLNGTRIDMSSASILGVQNSTVIKDSLSINDTHTLQAGFSRSTQSILNVSSLAVSGVLDGTLEASGSSFLADNASNIEADPGVGKEMKFSYSNIDIRGNVRANLDISGDNISINKTAKVSANGKGFGSRSGPGSGNNGDRFDEDQDTGAGYGGRGGRTDENFAEGDVYGSVRNPTQLGSGGGAFGSRGGGKILIDASNTLSINSKLSADAEDSGNGAGGTININASELEGNISVSASGGEGGFDEGGGAGGRIAVRYESNKTDNLDFDVSPGDAGFDGNPGQQGTVFIRQTGGNQVALKGTPDLRSSSIRSDQLTLLSDSDDIRLSNSNISSTGLSVGARVVADMEDTRTNFTEAVLGNSSDISLRRSSSSISTVDMEDSSVFRVTDAVSSLQTVEVGDQSSFSYSGKTTTLQSIVSGTGSTVAVRDSTLDGTQISLSENSRLDVRNSTVIRDSLSLNQTQTLSGGFSRPTETVLNITSFDISGTVDGVVKTSGDSLNLTGTGRIQAGNGPQKTVIINYQDISLRGATEANLDISAQGLEVSALATVSADGKGFGSQSGPGSGNNGDRFDEDQDTGAGHGGRGGRTDENFAEGDVYGSVRNPTQLGSGGGAFGSRGGGKILIDAQNANIKTSLSADAEDSGNGAGGTININASELEGNISVSASGGEGSFDEGGGAGGRIAVRYDSNQTDNLEFDVSPGDAGFDGNPGQQGTVFVRQTGGNQVALGGTPDLQNSDLNSQALRILNGSDDVRLRDSEITATSLSVGESARADLDNSDTEISSLVVESSGSLDFRNGNSSLQSIDLGSQASASMSGTSSELSTISIAEESSLSYGSLDESIQSLEMGNSSVVSVSDAEFVDTDFRIGSDTLLTITNSTVERSSLKLNASQTVSTASSPGSRTRLDIDHLSVNGTLDGVFSASGTVLSISDGGKVEGPSGKNTEFNASYDSMNISGKLRANARIASEQFLAKPGSVVSADGKGFGSRSGPGSGNNGDRFDEDQDTGAGYGGRGGRTDENFAEGDVYGSVRNPTQLGSGGGAFGSRGGGKILIDSQTADISAEVSANAEEFGNGAGGTVNLNASTLEGNISVSASGGEGSFDEGGGAGGRIAVRYDENRTDYLRTDVQPGDAGFDGNPGQQGTVFIRQRGGDRLVVAGTPRLGSSDINVETLVFGNGSDDVRMDDSNISSTALVAEKGSDARISGSKTNLTSVEAGDNVQISAQRIDSDIVNVSVGLDSTLDLDLSNSSINRLEVGNDSTLKHSDLGSEVSRLEAGRGANIRLSNAQFQRPDLDIEKSVSLTVSNSSLRFGDLDLNSTQSIRTGSRSEDRTRLSFDSLKLNGTLNGIFNVEADNALVQSYGRFVTPRGPGSTSQIDVSRLTIAGEMDGNFKMNSQEITALPGSSISADAKGYSATSGPGGGENGGDFDNFEHGGAGHGGEGGRSEDGAFGGDEYGNRTDPRTLGSGGGSGTGGGKILMDATERINLSTEVTANAEEFGNGAGGSISISAKRIAGNFSLRAEGGKDDFDDGAGAGGRIAVKYAFNETESTSFSVEPGRADGGGDDGEPGTVFTDILRIDFCDDRGLQDQCIVNTTKRVFRGLVEINSPLFTQESTRVFPQNQSTTFRFKNETTLSGSWRGNMTIEGDDIEIGAGAEFRPESGTITVK